MAITLIKLRKDEYAMKKKFIMTKREERLLKNLTLEQERRFKKTCEQFYPEGEVVDLKNPAVGDDEVFESLYWTKEWLSRNDNNREEQYETDKESILQIHQKVLAGKVGSIEVCFDKGTIRFGNNEYELSNTIVMMHLATDFEYAFFKEGDRYDARIFIETVSRDAFLVFQDREKEKDSNKGVAIISLDEFYLLGKRCNKKSGIMVGYDWGDNDIYCELVEKSLFSPIRELLVADWLQEKWQEAKEKNKKSIFQQEKIYIQKNDGKEECGDEQT